MDLPRAGRYEVRKLLGRGGAGSVYSGWDPLIGRPVAIKIMPVGEMAHADAMQWILREVQAAGALSHPNIVTVYDIGTSEDQAWIVMELISGGNLADAIHGDTLKTDQTVRVLAQVASALDETHRAGITHRDVKPANVLLKEDGTAKIGDFGIARFLNAGKLTKTGYLVGTPQYMSPEQLQAKSVDGKSDQFSLAIMAYEMFAGAPPFTGEAMVYQILTAEPPPFDPRQDPVFRKALAKNPEDRYASCSEFVRAIESALAVPAAASAGPPKWKYWATMAAIFGFIAVAAIGARVLLNSALDREQQSRTKPPVAAPVEAPKSESPSPALFPPPDRTPVRKSTPAQSPAPKPTELQSPPTMAEPAKTSPVGVTDTVIWSGRLAPGEVLTIEGGRPSAGDITRALPGVPINVRVTPSYVEIIEAPSEANGWKKMQLKSRRETDTIVIKYESRS